MAATDAAARRARASRCSTRRAITSSPPPIASTSRSCDRTASSCSGPSGCGKSTLLKAVGGYMRRSRARSASRGRGHAARARPHDGVPGVRPAAAVEDRQGERDVRADRERQARGQGSRGQGARVHRQGQPRQVRRQLSAHAVRRHEAARRDRARHGDGTRHPADGRAVRRARCADAAQDAGRAAAAVGRHALHRAVRHAFDRRGDQDRQPHPAAVAASRPGQGGDEQPAARRSG